MYEVIPFVLKSVDGAPLESLRVFGTDLIRVQEAILKDYPNASEIVIRDPQKQWRKVDLTADKKSFFWLIDGTTYVNEDGTPIAV